MNYISSIYNNPEYMEKCQLIESILIGYPRFDELLEEMEDCHVRSKVKAEPICMLVTGDFGAGKTTLYKQYKQRFLANNREESSESKILISIVPDTLTPKGYVQQLLYDIGDPCAERGTKTTQTERLKGYLKDKGVELIIFDEFQHFIDKDSKRLIGNAADWLKNLINATAIPVIAFGQKESSMILNVDGQLDRRFSKKETIEPFQYGDEFREFLLSVDQMLPLKHQSNLADEDLAKRIFFATQGVVGFIMLLITGAAEISLKYNNDKIEIEDLSDSFLDNIQKGINYPKEYKNVNPFVDNIDSFSIGESEHGRGEKATNNKRNSRKEREPRFNDIL